LYFQAVTSDFGATCAKRVEMTDDLTLGRLLGRREAFNLVAARCSATDALLLRDFREQKLYKGHAKDWEEFCTKFLHTSKANANRIIGYLQEFGPGYFEMAQLTRISPAAYRAIAPAVQDRKLLHNGDAIDLVPENAEKVAAAVAEMRKVKPAPPADPIPALNRRCRDLVGELTAVSQQREFAGALRPLLGYLQLQAKRLELTL
jgi:hypothetical protein